MEHNQHGIREILKKNKLIPVVTIDNSFELENTIETLFEKKINCIEITLRTKNSWSAVEKIKSKYGNHIKVGIGTVINNNQVMKAKDIGVDFMVSPGITEKIINSMIESEIPFLPGISNVSEIMLANQYKCETLKFFPAIISGGINTLNHYNKLFPNIMFCPTGGVTAINFRGFLELKNVISVAGSWLIKK